VRRFLPQFHLERIDEGAEQIQQITLAFLQQRDDTVVHQRAEEDRPHAVLHRGAIDHVDGAPRLVFVLDERHADLAEFHAIELGQQASAQCFGRDARAVREIEDGTFVGHL